MVGLTTPVRAHGVTWCEIDDEVLVLQGEQLQRLAGSAAHIWRHIDDMNSTAQIVSDLQAAFGPQPALDKDVPAFLAELERAGLVTLEATVPGRFSVPSMIAWDHDNERVVMADLRTGARTALSETATLVWLLAGGGLTAQEVVSDLSDRFPDAPPTLAADVVAVLDELVAGGRLRAG